MAQRPGNRSDNTQLRQLSATQNILNKADGSARFELGHTSVLVSVVGPVDVSLRDEKLDEATVEVVVRPATGYPGTKEKLLEQMLQNAFTPVILAGMMPRTLIQIVVQIIKDDGSALAAAVNAGTLALLDAGVPMKYMIAGITCTVDKTTNQVLMDPTEAEVQNAASVHTFVFDNLSNPPRPLFSDSTGRFSQDQFFTCHDQCSMAINQVHEFLRTSVETKKEKEYQQITA